jgi:hypothetical protein
MSQYTIPLYRSAYIENETIRLTRFPSQIVIAESVYRSIYDVSLLANMSNEVVFAPIIISKNAIAIKVNEIYNGIIPKWSVRAEDHANGHFLTHT